MSPQEFSQKIKAKNPSLQNVDDVELAQKIVSQHPEFAHDVDFGPSTTQAKTIFENAQAQDTPKPVEDTSFFDKIKNALSKRGEAMKQTFNDSGSGELDPVSGATQLVGQVAGGVNDIIGEGIGAILPGFVKRGIGTAVNAIGDTAPAQAIGQGWDAFKTKHPQAAKDLESVGNIAALFPAYKGAGLAGNLSEKAGVAMVDSAKVSKLATAEKFASDLVTPIGNKASKLDDVARTTETGSGIFKRSIIEPTMKEANAAREVLKVPGISPSNTFQQNFNIIQTHNKMLADNLVKEVGATKFIVSKKEVIAKLNAAAEKLVQESPLIVGDAERTAQKLIEGAKKFVAENAGDGSGLLKARKDFDSWVRTQKPNAFDAKSENAFTIANNEIRGTLTDILAKKAPDLALKEKLLAQHNLYNAMEIIAPKAMLEANTAIGRGMQSIGKVLGTKNKAVQAGAAVAGIGGLGAAATFAPIVAGVGIPAWLLYKGGKALAKPGVREAVGNVLKGVSKILPK